MVGLVRVLEAMFLTVATTADKAANKAQPQLFILVTIFESAGKVADGVLELHLGGASFALLDQSGPFRLALQFLLHE